MGVIKHQIIRYNHSRHGFYYGYGARKHTGIVSPASLEHSGFAGCCHGLLFAQEGGYRLESYSEIDGLTIAQPSLHSTAVIGKGGDAMRRRNENIVLLATPAFNSGKSFSIFKAFDGIDTEHSGTKSSM